MQKCSSEPRCRWLWVLLQVGACSSSSGSGSTDAAVDAGHDAAAVLELASVASAVRTSVCECGLCDVQALEASAECVSAALATAPARVRAELPCHVQRLANLEACVQAAACAPGELALCGRAVLESECELLPAALMRELADCAGVAPCVLQPASCIPAEFVCASGDGIPLAWRCNFIWDCLDGSDEQECSDLAFVCPDGREIPRDWRCDGAEDCEDGGDEAMCG